MSEDIIEKLAKAVQNYEAEVAESVSKQAIEAGVDPVKAIEDGLAKGIRVVGEKFGRGELFLMDLVAAAETMQRGINVLEPVMLAAGKSSKSMGKVVIGTAKGDIHDIGKNIVIVMLRAENFEVRDLGVDVAVEAFVKEAKEIDADIVGISALLTTTVQGQADVIQALKAAGLKKVKVMVGGAAASSDWAEKIGADAYAEDAITAVSAAKRLVGGGRNI